MNSEKLKENNPSGCDITQKLWKVALECNIEYPGIDGASKRITPVNIKNGTNQTFMFDLPSVS